MSDKTSSITTHESKIDLAQAFPIRTHALNAADHALIRQAREVIAKELRARDLLEGCPEEPPEASSLFNESCSGVRDMARVTPVTWDGWFARQIAFSVWNGACPPFSDCAAAWSEYAAGRDVMAMLSDPTRLRSPEVSDVFHAYDLSCRRVAALDDENAAQDGSINATGPEKIAAKQKENVAGRLVDALTELVPFAQCETISDVGAQVGVALEFLQSVIGSDDVDQGRLHSAYVALIGTLPTLLRNAERDLKRVIDPVFFNEAQATRDGARALIGLQIDYPA